MKKQGSATLLPFLSRQLRHVASGLLQLVGGGLLLSMRRRQFAWRTAAVGGGGFAAALWTIDAAVCAGALVDSPARLWGAVLAAARVMGWVHGRGAARLGVWESDLACALAAAAAALRFSGALAPLWRWSRHLVGLPSQPLRPAFWGAAGHPAWSFLLGPLWDRLVVLGAIGAWLTALIGGSLAVLLRAPGGGIDGGWRLEWGLARRAWRGEGSHGISVVSAVAVLGVALGVASLVTVNAVMAGYLADIRDKVLATHAHVVVQKYGLDFFDYDAVATSALVHPAVQSATPFVFNEVMLSAGAQGRGVLLKGVEPRGAAARAALGQQLCDPAALPQACALANTPAALAGREEVLDRLLRLPAAGSGALPKVLVGWELYQQLGRPKDGVITLTVPVGLASARGGLPSRQSFAVAGVFRGGMYEFDARLVYAPLAAAQQLFDMPGRVSGLELRVRDAAHVEPITAALRARLGRYPYRVNDWRELNAGLFAALALQKVVMFLVLCCMVVVASFNIAATLFMAVVEKTHAIAVLKSMGARDGSIMKMFVLQGWMVGAAGTAIGLLLGSGAALLLDRLHIDIAADVYMVDALRVRLQAADVALVALASLAISHLATLFPALQAAARPPAAALRLEV